MNSDCLVISNNPLVWKHANGKCRQISGTSLDVLYTTLNLLASGYALKTHPIAGNARLIHNPFRTVLLNMDNEGKPAPQRDFECMEYFIKKMENLGGEVPEKTVADYREVDYSLYLGMLEK